MSVKPNIKPKISIVPTTRENSVQKNDKGSEEFIFRALPLDRRVLESCGDRGVPKIAKIPTTTPVSPNLSTKRRSTVRKTFQSSSLSIQSTPRGVQSAFERSSVKRTN